MANWLKRKNVAQYAKSDGGAKWSGQLNRCSNTTAEEARQHADQNADVSYFFFCRESVCLPPQDDFEAGDAVFFKGDHWFGRAPQCDAYVKEKTPRRMVYVSGHSAHGEGPLQQADFDDLAKSEYTHINACFIHFNDEQYKLTLNDKSASDPSLNDIWQGFGSLQGNKAVMISVGGWNSGTWEWICRRAKAPGVGESAYEKAADTLADLVEKHGFDGIDLNLEGDWPKKNKNPSYDHQDDYPTTQAKLLVSLRKRLPDALLTITPIHDETAEQFGALKRVAQEQSKSWRDLVSWVNVQFYRENGRMMTVKEIEDFYPTSGIGADRLVAGFLANGKDEFTIASDVTEKLLSKPPFAGMFVWNYQDTKESTDKLAAATKTWDTIIG